MAAFFPLMSCLVHLRPKWVHWTDQGKKETLPETQPPLLPPTKTIHLLLVPKPLDHPWNAYLCCPSSSQRHKGTQSWENHPSSLGAFGSVTRQPRPDEFLWQIPGRHRNPIGPRRERRAVSVVRQHGGTGTALDPACSHLSPAPGEIQQLREQTPLTWDAVG